jgi:hypothetical protein
MKSKQWSILGKWFYENNKNLPSDVAEAIDDLLDEHQSEGEDESDADAAEASS